MSVTDRPAPTTFSPHPNQTTCVALESLRLRPSIRDPGSASEPHRSPASDPLLWEPIVVSCATFEVVDGHRRVSAAASMGATELRARWFYGDETDAIAEFIRLNTRDDVLNRAERQEAARRITRAHPDWSDRRISEICGISPKIVAQVRSVLGETVEAVRVMGTGGRIGRDGRVRPVDSRAQRARIAEAIMARPRASLREIAGAIGVSPETVRRVRTALVEQGTLDSSVPSAPDALLSTLARRRELPWQTDHAFTSRDEAAAVAEFFARTDTSAVDPVQHSRAIPLSRVYEVADEARRRAAFWSRFAESVENRSRKRCH
jgi:ParB-like chromosome segregation protein Spo0J